MANLFGLDTRLDAELSNNVYDAIDKAILATSEKYKYKAFDIAKLVMALYSNDFNYLVSKDDLRGQVKVLNDYFIEKYHHCVISFAIMRKILSYKGKGYYDLIMTNLCSAYSIITTGQNLPSVICEKFRKLLEDKKYDLVLNKIESDRDLRYAIAIIYERILNHKE